MTVPSYPDQIALPPLASWPEGVHVFDDDQRAALQAAEAARRPLLVRGEAGTGKSQLAQAAAAATQRRLISFVVDGRTEPSDLLWRYDAVARLADAQLGNAAVDKDGVHPARDANLYVTPGPLWWAMSWADAQRQFDKARSRPAPPEPLPERWAWTPARGCVLLIDEIDKAESDLPNALLEALGNARFVVPMLNHVVRPESEPPPLVIITSNDERELPAAFQRRCMLLRIALPEDDDLLCQHLLKLAEAHAKRLPGVSDQVKVQAARLLAEDRETARRQDIYRPGPAEYLDLLRALAHSPGDPARNLERMRAFAYKVGDSSAT